MDQQKPELPKPELHLPTKIKLGYSEIHYRGVFATADIGEGELIERCPVVVLSLRSNHQKDSVIRAYAYINPCDCEECRTNGGLFLMAMGYGQMYNHQDENNALFTVNFEQKIIDITATRKILKGQEIFINYGPSYFKNRNKIESNRPD